MTAADQQRAARATRTGEGLEAGNVRARSAQLLRDGGWSAACGWTGARGRVPTARFVARVRGGEPKCGVREATAGPIPSTTTRVRSVGGSLTAPLLRLVHEPVRTA